MLHPDDFNSYKMQALVEMKDKPRKAITNGTAVNSVEVSIPGGQWKVSVDRNNLYAFYNTNPSDNPVNIKDGAWHSFSFNLQRPSKVEVALEYEADESVEIQVFAGATLIKSLTVATTNRQKVKTEAIVTPEISIDRLHAIRVKAVGGRVTLHSVILKSQ